LQGAKATERRGVCVNQIDGIVLHKLENSISNQPDNRSFTQPRPPLRDGPFGEFAAVRSPAVSDIFHDSFRGLRIVDDLKRASEGLRTESQPVLRGDEMKTANAVAGVHRPRVIEHMEDA
jgi:hypothetical protein